MRPTEKSLGNVIYDARIAKDITLREAARQLEIAPSYLSDIENDRRVPADEVMQRIARLLGLEFDDLMARAGRVGEQAERFLRQQPAAGVLFRRLAETGATAKDVERLLTEYEKVTKRRGES